MTKIICRHGFSLELPPPGNVAYFACGCYINEERKLLQTKVNR